MATQLDREVVVQLDGDSALTLFELLARQAESGGRLTVEHAGESVALDALEASLERVLAEPFAPDYRELLAAARERLAAR